MNSGLKKISWRALGVALLGLSLVGAAAFSVSTHPAPAQASTGKHISIKPSGAAKIVKTGFVDMSKLPAATGHAPATLRNLPTNRDSMTPAQRQAYINSLKHATFPQVTQRLAAPKGALPTPSFDACGYTALPCQVYGHNGLNSSQSGGWYPPDQAIASNPSYVMEGVNNEDVVYNFSGGVVSGPIYSFTFFNSILTNGDTLSDPQMFWDASRLHWIIVEVEIHINGSGIVDAGYYDIAVSKTQNVALNPATQYYLYKVNANVGLGPGGNWCDYPTIGGDYWGLWLDCVAFDNTSNGFQGNAVFGLNKNGLYAGTGASGYYYTQIPAPNGSPAYRLSSVDQDGTADAEFLIATDAGLGASNDTGLTTCAFTNTRGLATGTAPHATCVINALPIGYTDPVNASQPGFANSIYPGYGTKQIEYKGGNLYFAITTAVSGTQDGVYWAEVQPQLSALDPANPGNQVIANTIMRQAGIFAYGNGADAYMPSIQGSSEDDIVLVFNYSSSTVYPSIVDTGRRATDAPGAMGDGGSSQYVINGSSTNTSGRWGDYSACSLDTNLTSRGLIWCGGEYGGATAATGGWDTWVYGLRVE